MEADLIESLQAVAEPDGAAIIPVEPETFQQMNWSDCGSQGLPGLNVTIPPSVMRQLNLLPTKIRSFSCSINNLKRFSYDRKVTEKYCSKNSTSGLQTASSSSTEISPEEVCSVPEVPTTCCGTGCHNCVWIDYVDRLVEFYKDGGAKARNAVNKIDDVSLRTFLEMELKGKLWCSSAYEFKTSKGKL